MTCFKNNEWYRENCLHTHISWACALAKGGTQYYRYLSSGTKMTKHVTWFPAQGGGGGVLRISSDRDDRMGAKIKTKKSPLGFK